MNGRPDSALPLPPEPRGRYDRSKTTAERRAAHITRLVVAAAAELRARGRAGLTVSDVVRRAGVGRNTFYASFRDLDHLLLHMEETALSLIWRRASDALAEAYTPIEKLRALSRAWLSALHEQPDLGWAALSAPAREKTATSRAGDPIARLLTAALDHGRRDGVLSVAADELRVLSAIAMFEALGKYYIATAADPEQIEPTLVDQVLRSFR